QAGTTLAIAARPPELGPVISISAAIVTGDFAGVAAEPVDAAFFEELLHAPNSSDAAATTDSMPTYFRGDHKTIENPPHSVDQRRPTGAASPP
ncbi:MAG TPA: hypothetical protein VFV02_00730, partial [Acidimicrobiales bacterium]|nr:hypothetical protein [Acidimicrobiales bacterium]